MHIGARTFGYDPETAVWVYSPAVDYNDSFGQEKLVTVIDDAGCLNADKMHDGPK